MLSFRRQRLNTIKLIFRFHFSSVLVVVTNCCQRTSNTIGQVHLFLLNGKAPRDIDLVPFNKWIVNELFNFRTDKRQLHRGLA